MERKIMKACIGCGKCARACKMDVDPVVNPNSAECIRCGACASACPKQAIQLKFGSSKQKKNKEHSHEK